MGGLMTWVDDKFKKKRRALKSQQRGDRLVPLNAYDDIPVRSQKWKIRSGCRRDHCVTYGMINLVGNQMLQCFGLLQGQCSTSVDDVALLPFLPFG